jgi:hypothetical protein
MDGYVRLCEDRFKVPDDNPTIGLILCADKGEAVAKYFVLNESQQIFVSQYLQYLPSDEQLRIELEENIHLSKRSWLKVRVIKMNENEAVRPRKSEGVKSPRLKHWTKPPQPDKVTALLHSGISQCPS